MTATLESIGAVPLAEMRGALAPAAKGIPLRDRKGIIRAFAMVDAGTFPWACQFNWHQDNGGYVRRNGPRTDDGWQRPIQLHREVMGLKHRNPWHVDHINHDTLDNRRCNLRLCTHAQNHENRRGSGNRGSSSRFRGVSRKRDRKTRPWQAYAKRGGQTVHLGFYDAEEEAARVAAEWRRSNMPYSTD